MTWRIGILGAGGLGKKAAEILGLKTEMLLVAICDSRGFLFNTEGLDTKAISALDVNSTVADLKGGKATRDSIAEMIEIASFLDGIFVALPNMPNDFVPSVVRRFAEAGRSLAFTDALKRTSAMSLMFDLDEKVKRAKSVYITGCGATPGLLTAAAVVAAQSFREITSVRVYWGVGISNWETYKATIREDIAHLPGYDLEKAKAMTDREVDELLAKTGGRLTFEKMEHADDVLLVRAGVVDSLDKVTVGGVLDTRSARKPVSTTVTVTGITYEGKMASHTFTLGDETMMSDNVIGPALGYLKRALWLKSKAIHGVFGSTEFMPMMAK